MKNFRRNGNRSLCNGSKGFTLVELIVVLLIIAMLAALAVPLMLGFIDDAHKKQVIARGQTALAATQASLSDIYTSNDNEFTPDKREQTRIQAGAAADTAFTVWNQRPLYDERDGERPSTVAVTAELGAYTVARAIYKDDENHYAAYNGTGWEVYDSLAKAQEVLGIADDDESVIYVWPYTEYSDTARQPGDDPRPDPADPNPDKPVVLASKTVKLRPEGKKRAFFADKPEATESVKDEIEVKFYIDEDKSWSTDWTWPDGVNVFTRDGEKFLLNIVRTYIFRDWEEEGTGKICKDKTAIGDYIVDQPGDLFVFNARVIRDPNLKEQAVVSNDLLNKMVSGHDTDRVEMVPQDAYELETLPANIKKEENRIDDDTNPGFYIYAWYDGKTLKWWTNALVAFMPENCDGMLSGTDRLHAFSFQGFDVSRIKTANRLFAESRKLNKVEFGDEFEAPKLCEMKEAFSAAHGLNGTLDLSGILELGSTLDLNTCFKGMDHVTEIKFSDAFKKATVTELKQTFCDCTALTKIDLSGWKFNGGGIGSCYETFRKCTSMTQVDLGGDFYLNGCVSMKRMFYYDDKLIRINGRLCTGPELTNMRECFDTNKSLITVDLSGVDPTNVVSFRSMFKKALSLQELDLKSWNNKPCKVENIQQMFQEASLVKELDLSGWNLSNLKSMQSAFYKCSSAQIIVNGWGKKENAPKGGKLYSVASAFRGCSSMTGTVDLSYWDTTNLQEGKPDEPDPDSGQTWDDTNAIQHMFDGCGKLQCVILREWDLSGVAGDHAFDAVYGGCNSIEYIDYTGMKFTGTGYEGSIKGLCTVNKAKLKTVILKGAQFDNITSLAQMYNSAKSLELIDLTDLKVLNATSAVEMFKDCYKLTTVKMSGMDARKVESAKAMFQNCKALEEFSEKGFDMSAVTSLESCFEGCSSLKRFDISAFPVSKVESMLKMFASCTSLQKADISSFDTRSVKTMVSMFDGCTALEELNISKLELPKITETSQVDKFINNCPALKKLSISYWKNEYIIFKAIIGWGKSRVETLDASYCAPANMSDVSGLFSSSGALKDLDITKFDMSGVSSAYQMFNACPKLEKIKLTDVDFSKITTMEAMFQDCKALKNIDISGMNSSSVTTMKSMFRNCYALTGIKMSGLKTLSLTTTEAMFQNCYRLETVDLGSGIHLDKVTTVAFMFQDCINLKSIDTAKIYTTDKLESAEGIFKGCFSLPSVSLENFNLSNITIITGMFNMEDWINGKKVDGAGINISKEQFEQMSALTLIEFGPDCVTNKITTSNSIGSLFKYCVNLTTIKVYPGTDFTGLTPTNKKNIFLGDKKIVGGKGTTYQDEWHKNAKIDGGSSDPGYFTDITAGN